MPVTVPLKPLQPGGQVSASNFNKLQQLVQQILRMVGGGGGIGISHGAGGMSLRQPQGPIWAELLTAPAVPSSSGSVVGTSATDVDSGEFNPATGTSSTDPSSGSSSSSGACEGYGWRQIIRDTCGAWIVPGDAASGTGTSLPAFELNGRTVPLATGNHKTRVQLWPAGDDRESWIFVWSAGGSSTGGGPGEDPLIPVDIVICAGGSVEGSSSSGGGL